MFKSYSFFSYKLTKRKYALLYNKAKIILELKNTLVSIINEDISSFMNTSKYDLYKRYITNSTILDNILLNVKDKECLIQELYDAFINRYDALVFSYKTIENYLIEESIPKKDAKKLSYIIPYLIKYGKVTSEKHKEIYNSYDPDDLINIVSSVKDMIINYMKTNTIVFKQLTFKSTDQGSKKFKFIHTKGNTTYLMLSAIEKKKPLCIPIKISGFHGNTADYLKKNMLYTIQLLNNRVIRVILPKEVNDEPALINKDITISNTLGVDVNIKTNLFRTNDGLNIDHNRSKLNDYIKYLTKYDIKRTNKYNNGQSKINMAKNDKEKSDKWLRRMQGIFQEKCSEVVKYAINKGYKSIVMEDLGTFNNDKIDVKIDGTKFSLNRLTRLLHFGTLNKIMKGIAYKKGIELVLIHSAYTSKQCSKCGSLETTRPNQAILNCIKCGSIDADTNAAINIRDRYVDEDQRTKLLKFEKNIGWRPRKISLPELKNFLIEAFA